MPLVLLATMLLGACHEGAEQAGQADMEQLPDSDGLVLQVSRVSKLYTAEYQVHKIVTHDDVRYLEASIGGMTYKTPISLGDRKIAIPINVTLKAYVDFSGFSTRNIERSADGSTLHVTLPDPKVVVTASKVEHAQMQQYVDWLRSDFTDQEMADYTRQGVEAVLRTVPQMGILETARQSAAAQLIPLFARMGYKEERIVVTFRKDFGKADMPRLYDAENSVVKLNKKGGGQ